MRGNDEVAEGAKDAKHGNVDGVVRGGIYGEGEGVKTVVLKWDNGIFGGVLFAILVESVFHGEPGRVPEATCTNRKRDGLRKG